MSPSIKAAPASRPQVYFFATCVIDLFYPDAGMDAIAVLEHAGFEVLFPESQTCCGQPAYTSGFPEEAREVMRAQLTLFPAPLPIVVPSGSCMGMMRHHWPHLCGEDAALRSRVSDISARVVEFTDFIADRIDLSKLKRKSQQVCLHTSCSARRETGALSSGRKVLAGLPGVTLLIQDHESECCGFGGTFSVKHPEISAAMANDKVAALTASGCDSFVSADCGCLLNLNTTLEKRGMPLRGRHVASLLRDRLPDDGVIL
ncbi:(Fe-S)-binding protein [Steroidobacter flavus]|uniref:(Fe-S)-binding protein n=1 Tax=Steroidobacter flavus TaxID=1842136 RepID=A0ABV8SZ84_9GAMM